MHSPFQRMRRKPTVNPLREASDTNFMWAAEWLIGPRTFEARLERGPAKSCLWSLSRSRKIISNFLLFMLRNFIKGAIAIQTTISKASAVLYAMEGARNPFSQMGERESEHRSAIVPTSRLNFLKALGKRGRTCCNSTASHEADGENDPQSQDQDHIWSQHQEG